MNKDDELAAAAAVDVDDDDDEEAVVVDEEAAFRPASRRPFDCSDDDTSGCCTDLAGLALSRNGELRMVDEDDDEVDEIVFGANELTLW